jgi:hypothetical protein
MDVMRHVRVADSYPGRQIGVELKLSVSVSPPAAGPSTVQAM